MSEQEASRFFETLRVDCDLQRSIGKIASDPLLVIAEVHRWGFDCSPEELRDALAEYLELPLTERDLQELAAGKTDVAVGAALGVSVAITGVVLASAAAAAI